MSLLNDALKRASQFQQEHDTVRLNLPPAPLPPIAPPPPEWQPMAAPATPRAGLGWALPLVILLIFTVVGLAALAHFSRKHPRHVTSIIPASAPIRAVPAPRPTPPPAAKPTASATAPAPLAWPRLKVQGITYYDGKWQAIVNGRTVYVGYSINGIRVARISQYRVSFVAPDGSKKTMLLGE